jgi:hypothetical protein
MRAVITCSISGIEGKAQPEPIKSGHFNSRNGPIIAEVPWLLTAFRGGWDPKLGRIVSRHRHQQPTVYSQDCE